jgi:hypothetical protein
VCSFLPLIGLLTAFLPDLKAIESHRQTEPVQEVGPAEP